MRPTREHATNNGQTYMVTSSTWGRRALFQKERWARLLIDTLYHYRGSVYLLHEFVIMPDHFHVIVTPQTSLEKAVQFIKGGFSYRAKKELGSNMEVWQKGFSDHRFRDASDYRIHQIHVQQNPVRKHLCQAAREYPYSSAHDGFELDPAPQGLKPARSEEPDTARLEGVPFQGKSCAVAPEAPSFAVALEGVPFQDKSFAVPPEAAAFQSKNVNDAPEGAIFLTKVEPHRIEALTHALKNKTA